MLVDLKSLVRICLASAAIYGIALKVSFPALWLPVIYLGLFALYGAMLWAMRELRREDYQTLKRIVPQKWGID